MLRFIARTRSRYPRCQACIWLIISIICVLSSSKFWLVEWSTLRFIAAILCVLFLALLPTYSPQNRLNLREIFRNDIYAVVKGVGTVRFFNMFNSLGSYLKLEEELYLYLAAISFYLYILAVDVEFGVDEGIGLSDGLIFAVYAQLVTPAWVIDCALNLLVVYKYLNPQAPVEVEGEHEDQFFDFFDFVEEDQLEAQVEIQVFQEEIDIDDDIDSDVEAAEIGVDEGAAEIGVDEGADVMEGDVEANDAEAIVADEIADVEANDAEAIVADEIADVEANDAEAIVADVIADVQAEEIPWAYCVCTIVLMVLFLLD